MARSLASKPNVVAPGGSYPFGRIKDKGGTAGTPVNEQVYGDMHQFFEKMMSLAGLVANGLPENNTDGFQFIQAMQKLFVNAPSGIQLNTKIIDIVNWNMNQSAAGAPTFSVLHGLGSTNYKKIKSISVIVRDDADSQYYDVLHDGNLTNGRIGLIDSTQIIVSTAAGGTFDNNNFDSTGGYVRGYCTIQYTS